MKTVEVEKATMPLSDYAKKVKKEPVIITRVVRFIRRGEVKVITARDMNTWEKDYFKKRGK